MHTPAASTTNARGFAKSMVRHHQEALRMAKAFLAGPDAGDETLGPLAKSILDTQQQEIDTMRAWQERETAPTTNRSSPVATPGSKQTPVDAAIAQFMQALQESEGMALKGGKGVKVEIEAEGAGEGDMDECPMCAAGACDNPDHMGEEDVAGLAEAYR